MHIECRKLCTSTKLPRSASGDLLPVHYQRLVLPLHFPDGSAAIGVLAARTNNVEIESLDSAEFTKLAKRDTMEFDL